MRKIENFDKITEAGEFQQLPAGVYGAVITNAIDVTDREYLEIYWDVAKGEYAHYFKSLVDAGLTDSSKSIRSYKDSAVRFFKSFITAIEKTNSGYEWDWNEKSLIGKKVMVVVGEEEYIDKDGNVKTFTKAQEFRSLQSYKDGKLKTPELKKLTEKDWELWRSKNPSANTNNTAALDITDDDLPF